MGFSENSTLVDNSPCGAPYLLSPSAANRLVGGDSHDLGCLNAVTELVASKIVNGEHELAVQSLPEQHLCSGETKVSNGLTKCILVGGGNNVVCDLKEDMISRENSCLHMPQNNVNIEKEVCVINKDGIKAELEDIDLLELEMMGDVECDFSGLCLQDEEDDINVCGVEVEGPCLGVGRFENSDSGNSFISHMMSSNLMDEDGNNFVQKRQLAGGVTEACQDGKDKKAVGMHLGEKICSPNKGSLATLQSCESSRIVDYSNGIADGDVLKTDDEFGASNCITTVDCCGLTDKEGRDKGGYSRSLETRILQDMYFSPHGSTCMTKSSMQTQTTQVARRSMKTVEKMSQTSQTVQIFPMVTRKKRSCFYKPARSSIWGLLGTIAQVFEHNNDLNHVSQQEKCSKSNKKRGKNSTGNKKTGKNSAGEKFLRSDGQFCSSTGHIRLKVKIGKEECKSNPTVFESVNVGTLPRAPSDFKEPTVDLGTGSWLSKSAGCVEEDRMTKAESDLDVCALGSHITTKSFLVSANLSISAQKGQSFPLICSQKEDGELDGGIDNRYMDIGTSPDSEVINLVPDSQVGVKAQEDLHDAALPSPNVVADPADVSNLNMPSIINRKGTRNRGEGKCDVKDELPGSVRSERARLSGKRGHRKRVGTLSTHGFVPSNISSRSEVTESGISEDQEVVRVERGLLDDQNPEMPPSKSSKSRGRSSRSDSPNSGKSRRGNASRHKEKGQKSVSKSKAKERHSPEQDAYIVAEHLKSGLGETVTINEIASDGMSNMEVTLTAKVEQDLPQRSAWVRCDDCHKWRCISAALADSIEETNCKWTCKDNLDEAFADCSVPQEKSNAAINRELEISDASCDEDAYDTPLNYNGLEWRNSAVPQPSQWMLIRSNLFLHRHRKTQTIDEIMVCHCKPPRDGRMGCGDECLNRMLNIECVQGTCPCGDLCSNQQFQKRKYAKLKWFRCGKKGYGLQLLQDISQGQFLIEYVGEVLDLHTYQARQRDYASRGHKHFYFMTLNGSEIIDACAKGNLGRFINHSCDPNCRTEKWMVNGEVCIGLFALRDIKKDEEVTFDYNYVRVFGAAVKKCVCGSPHCRGYIGGDPHNAEVIVQGDSDEEYPEPVMIHEEDENIESIVDHNLMSKTVENQYPEISSKGDRMNEPVVANVPLKLPTENEESVCKPVSTVSQLQDSLEIEDETRKLPASIKPMELTLQKEDIRSNIESADQRISSEREIHSKSSDIQRFEGSLPRTTENSLCDSIGGNKKSVHNNVEEKPVFSKLLSIVKASRCSVKKAKAKNNHVSEKKCQTTHVKSQALSSKPKKLEISANGRVDGVEEKLNELLNAEGGISKRKDAAKGYLKLLFLTAASGDSGNGEAIQSTRDLSMILDALLKTKSRMVLVDIINKNGLQMLHNIMKQNRKDFNKIPVLRKLLKVLEYLAGREVLTLEHIIAGPPCPGMESFRESMLLLTEHSDKQVHQIARSFRDKWIPKHLRKITCMNRVDVTIEFQRGPNCNNFSSHKRWHDWGLRSSDAIDCVNNGTCSTTLSDSGIQDGTSAPYVSDCPSGRTKGQKRKSRWDQPAETDIRSSHCKELKMQHGLLQRHESGTRIEHDELVLDHVYQCEKNCSSSTQQKGVDVVGDGKENSHEDVPPGFSIPLGDPLVLSNVLSTSADLDTGHSECPSDLVTGHPQRFDSASPVFYGIPLGTMQQYGTGPAETAKSWVVAPGVPFQPFPPLPPYPRGRRHPPSNSAKLSLQNQSHAVQHDNLPSHQTNRICPSVSGAGPQDMVFTNGNGQPLLNRGRDTHLLGRHYFRQQKWNVPKVGPPWVRMRNNWGFVGNQSRNGICSVDMGNVADGPRGLPDGRSRRENGGNFFYQHSWPQN